MLKLSLKDKLEIALCIALVCVCAFIVIPVPFATAMLSMQTLALVLTSLILTPKKTFCAIALYILLGVIGLPVFIGGTSGFGELIGPRGGFFFAFLIAYPLVSYFRGEEISLKRFALASVLISVPLTSLGSTLSVAYCLKMSFSQAFLIAAAPFLIGDVVKAIVASWIAVRYLNVTKNLK